MDRGKKQFEGHTCVTDAIKKKSFLEKQGRGHTRKQKFVTCSHTLASCGSWVLNLNQQKLQLSVRMLVRTRLQKVSLSLA